MIESHNSKLPRELWKKLQPVPGNQPYTETLNLTSALHFAKRAATFYVEGRVAFAYEAAHCRAYIVGEKEKGDVVYEYLPIHEPEFQEKIGKALSASEKYAESHFKKLADSLGKTNPDTIMGGILKGATAKPPTT